MNCVMNIIIAGFNMKYYKYQFTISNYHSSTVYGEIIQGHSTFV